MCLHRKNIEKMSFITVKAKVIIILTEGYSRKKYQGGEGGGKTAGDIFFYGWLVWKVFKLYGSLVFDQI